MAWHVFMFSKIKPEHRLQLLPTEDDSLYSTTGTRLKNSELVQKYPAPSLSADQ